MLCLYGRRTGGEIPCARTLQYERTTPINALPAREEDGLEGTRCVHAAGTLGRSAIPAKLFYPPVCVYVFSLHIVELLYS